MKVLVCKFKCQSVNPNASLTDDLLSSLGDVTFYGPGYSESSEINAGLADFIKGKQFDVIFTLPVPHDLSMKQMKSDAQFVLKSLNCEFSRNEYIAFINDLKNYKYDIPFVLLFNHIDAHVFKIKRYIHLLDKCLFCVTLWGKQMINKNIDSSLPIYPKDYITLVHDMPDKIFPCYFFISKNELNCAGLNQRNFSWSVCGTQYPYRKKAKTILKNVDLYDKFRLRAKTLTLIASLFGRNYSTIIKMQNNYHHTALISSKMSYTCGHLTHQLLRKHLEIPARSNVLITNKVNGIGSLGFIDQKSYISASPDQLLDLHTELLDNPNKFQEIAINGYNVIKDFHMLHTRSQQLKEAVKLSLQNNYFGSYWHFGELKCYIN